MKRFFLMILGVILISASIPGREAAAALRGRVARRPAQAQTQVQTQATTQPWHGDYYDSAWGMPMAVIVPPQAKTQTNWGWGVGGNSVTAIQPQFQGGASAPAENPHARFQSTPPWPSNTNQFGDYYIRAPR